MISLPTRNGNVVLLWAASALSSGSTWVMQIGLFIRVLQDFSPAVLAVVELVGTLPALLFTVLAGTLADRMDVRRLAIGSMLAQTLCVLGMTLVLHTSIWFAAGFYALQGISNTVWAPSRQQWLYGVIAVEARASANAAIGSIGGVMTIIGASLGGVLAAWSPTGAMATACGIQLLAAVPLLRLARKPLHRPTAPSTADRARREPFFRELAAGIRVLRDLPLARSVVWIGIAWGFIGGAYNTLLASYATTTLHGNGTVLGVLYVADGAAVIIGTLIAARTALRHHLSAYATSYMIQGLAWSAMFFAGHPVVAVVLLAVMRLASGIIIGLDTTLLLATVPASLRGRVSSIHMTTYNGVARLSLAVFGGLLAVTDIRTIGVCTGIASVLLGAVWWWRRDPEAERLYAAGGVENAVAG
ncbi:MFS transporter [Streptomyces sp. NPDC051576]|uniref:MFS transporter n=1 Tax=Streptomyces sp. NPDC051576 TaxID=3155803 RepID=UPI0034263984